MDIQLTDTEVRILGCLLEKEATTPGYYPLTLNALLAACNQKSNREPVMMLDEKTVVKALEDLRYEQHLVCRISEAGSRVPKYSHTMQDHWNFSSAELAVLCELFLRGPQTMGELRTHSARMHRFADTEAVLGVLEELAGRDSGALVMQLPREPGRRERRWAHLFAGEVQPIKADTCRADEPMRPQIQEDDERIEILEQEVERLRVTVGELQVQFEQFRRQFD
jgi:hypothetical protein